MLFFGTTSVVPQLRIISFSLSLLEKHTVFVGNIAFDASEEDLKNVFEENGLTPTGARILTRNDGTSKG